MKAGEITAFVGANARRYLRVFKKMAHTHTRAHWNWAACLLPAYWLMARKCYKPGVLMVFFEALTSGLLMLTGFDQLLTAVNQDDASLRVLLQTVGAHQLLGVMILAAVSILVRVGFGAFGDWIYRRRVYGAVAQLRQDGQGDLSALAMAGGVNLFAAVAAYLAANLLSMVISMGIGS